MKFRAIPVCGGGIQYFDGGLKNPIFGAGLENLIFWWGSQKSDILGRKSNYLVDMQSKIGQKIGGLEEMCVVGKIRQKICARGKNWAQRILVKGKKLAKCVFVW